MNKNNIISVPDPRFKVWYNPSIKTTRIIKPKSFPIQVYKDMWHPNLDKEYIANCLREPVKRANYVNRVIYYIFTSDGNEGFIPVPKYCPAAFQSKDKNPPIMFLYKVNSQGLFYFK